LKKNIILFALLICFCSTLIAEEYYNIDFKFFIGIFNAGYIYADIIPCKSSECDCINNQYVSDVCDYFLSKYEYKLSRNKINFNDEITFSKKYDEFNLFTEFDIGDNFYCADTANIIPIKLNAFVIQYEGENVLTFKLRFEVPDVKLFENIENYNFKYFIISNNPDISTIRNNLNLAEDKINILIKGFKDNIVFPGNEPYNYMGFPPYFAIFEGSFSTSNEKEYIICRCIVGFNPGSILLFKILP
jgi:hypothetical protein